jgi:hypothetical protein
MRFVRCGDTLTHTGITRSLHRSTQDHTQAGSGDCERPDVGAWAMPMGAGGARARRYTLRTPMMDEHHAARPATRTHTHTVT